MAVAQCATLPLMVASPRPTKALCACSSRSKRRFPRGERVIGETRILGTGLTNFLWIVLAGIWLTIGHVVVGVVLCLTLIGIPFGLAHFKLASVSFAPLGKRVVST